MKIDLDELERKASQPPSWTAVYRADATPDETLALIARIRELEGALSTVTSLRS